MKSLSDLCTPRPSVFDAALSDTALDLTDLFEGKIDPETFFAENFLTEGIKQLLQMGLRRLAGQSDQGAFILSQSMGGGKTHSMVTLGLLAAEPQFRQQVMGELFESNHDPKDVRVIGFSGRERPTHGIWGALAEQLEKKEVFNDYYSPLQAPGQSAWISLLSGPPTLILLDELPTYLEDMRSKEVGNSDLSRVTTSALSNLLVAINKPELSNVCVVISDLKATYQGGSSALNTSLRDFESETQRTALKLSPVALNSDEIFQILKKRIFETLPDEREIAVIADGYSQSVDDARKMDLTSASPPEYKRQIQLSYPFHYSLRDLYARFRENPGFQQTRGLIRLMRTVTAHLWESKQAGEQALIHPYDIDLNHQGTKDQIQGINPTLENAIAHDVASSGRSEAERIDVERGDGNHDAQQAAQLLMVSSLASVQGATLGLSISETVAFLCRPGRDVSKLRKDVIGLLSTRAWYLHSDRDGRLFFKNVENVVAKLKTTAESYTQEMQMGELRSFLEKSFKPILHKDCYHEVKALIPADEIKPDKEHCLLVIAEPAIGGGLSDTIQKLWDDTTYKNRLAFLTGEREVLDRLLERSAELKAINSIIAELEREKVPDNDPQLGNARELRDKFQIQLLSAAREGFTKLYYPSKDGLLAADFLMNWTGNDYNGEAQVRDLLLSKQKFTLDVDSETFRKKCEQRLFTQQVMDFNEIKRRAATNSQWPWHKPAALDSLKSRLILEDAWRENSGLIDKGPFPPPSTSVQPQILRRDDETGEVTLRLKPIHADVVHYEMGSPATTGSAKVQNLQEFVTKELRHSFLAVDSTGVNTTGSAEPWTNTITLRQRFFQNGDKRMCELHSAPPAPITYTTDGSDPQNGGGTYSAPFEVPDGTVCVLAFAEKDGVKSQVERADVPKGKDPVAIDPVKPALWKRHHARKTTKESYEFLAAVEKSKASMIGCGVNVGSNVWMELNTDSTTPLSREALESIITPIRTLVATGEVQLTVSELSFPTGQHLLDWVNENKDELAENEVTQNEERTHSDA